jgi:alcohol dehydrogenase
VERGQRVGVIGAGAIGLVCLVVARALGVEDVVVTDLSPERRTWAERLGASAVGEALSDEFDVIIDAVGAAPTRRASLEHLRPGGTTVWVGLLTSDVDFDAKGLVRREQRVVGSFAYTPAEFDEAAELAADVDTSFVSTVPLRDGAQVFGELAAGRSDLVKVLLTPDDAA